MCSWVELSNAACGACYGCCALCVSWLLWLLHFLLKVSSFCISTHDQAYWCQVIGVGVNYSNWNALHWFCVERRPPSVIPLLAVLLILVQVQAVVRQIHTPFPLPEGCRAAVVWLGSLDSSSVNVMNLMFPFWYIYFSKVWIPLFYQHLNPI